MLMRAASLAGLVLSFVACFILLVIAAGLDDFGGNMSSKTEWPAGGEHSGRASVIMRRFTAS